MDMTLPANATAETPEQASFWDDTLRASQTVKWSVLVLLVLFGVTQLVRLKPRPRGGPYWTLLDLAYTVLLVGAAVLIIVNDVVTGITSTVSLEKPVVWNVATDAAQAVSLVTITILSWSRLLRVQGSSSFAFSLLGLLATATAVDVVLLEHRLSTQKYSIVTESVSGSQIIFTTAVAVLLCGSFLAAGFQDTVLRRSARIREKARRIPRDEDNLSPFARMFCVTLFPLFEMVFKGGTPTDEVLPLLRGVLRCKDIVDRLHSLLSKNVRRRLDFLVALLRVLWLDTFRVVLSTTAYFACLFVKVPLLEHLINASDQSERFFSAVLFLVATLAECLTNVYSNETSCIMGCRLRAVLQAAIFNKMTRLSPTARAATSTGHVLSMLGVDCFQLSMSAFVFPFPACGVLCMPILLYLLAQRVGAAVGLCCAAYLVCAFLVCVPISRLQDTLWRRQTNARDERLKKTSDLLSSVRLVKMYAWEGAYRDKLMHARDVEMKPLFWVNVLDGIIDSIFSATGSVLVIILFGTLIIFNQEHVLTVAASFSSVYLIYMTDVTMAQMCWALRVRSQIFLSMKRIVNFCTEEEHDDQTGGCDADKLRQKKGEVIMSECTLSWSKPENNKLRAGLTNVNLHVSPGSLVGVVGFVGSGKSSLLAGILGDMHISGGRVKCTGRVAYVPQIASVHNMSVRDNILYGQPMKAKDYDRVLEACQLHEDINTFPAGDLTVVGEKGETLSGGQKQRISLARAAYNQADVYLLDDPLSALDVVVAKKVFKKVIGKEGILKKKTRIMACNQGSFLNHMDKLVLLHNGGASVFDTLVDLLKDNNAPETLRHESESTHREDRLIENTGYDADLAEEGSNGRVIKDELPGSTKSFWQLIRALARMSGPCLGIGFLACVVSAVALGWQLDWVRTWTRTEGSMVPMESQESPWIWALAAICATDVIARCLGSVLLAAAMRRLSSLLHGEMIHAILSSPVTFFGSTPRGSIVNRFSVDLDYIDNRLYLTGKQSVQHTLFAVSRLVIIGTQSKFVLVVGVASSVLLICLLRLATRASKLPKVRESLHTSRLLSHVTETMDSLSSIRAYGVLECFSYHLCRLVDDVVRAYWTFVSVYRYVRLAAVFCGFVTLFCTVLFAVLLLPEDSAVDPSAIGLSLSAASLLIQTLAIACPMMFSCLHSMSGFERCIEYTELPQESEVEPGEKKYDFSVELSDAPGWPQKGKVEFVSYSASYKPGILPDVLKDITFTVHPTEKVGVVGRTGAGKSSLVMALLRVLKSSQGFILIDGVDIARVPLQKLRTCVTVIPQDPSLVRGTLRENLDPTNSHTDKEIWAALEQAHLGDVVSRDPKQLLLDTGDGGSSFSVGERQLLCLARALLRRPRLLVLDEATSQMDGDTDQLIQATLREAFATCTQLTIAHRLHTIIDYDKVLVMGDGRILEFGTVQELLSNPSSVFKQMAKETLLKTAHRPSTPTEIHHF